ncbi:hypothetical protein CLF_106846 [Clonorchis sinensis]|uniref:Uncharacterized protein n=1 Tax=Clonorchis sinensis TaxID=79923 RepID=G7YFU9_CLOSI|nr:hypothetical protein CLF_106846 [Clonorchis sinensis]
MVTFAKLDTYGADVTLVGLPRAQYALWWYHSHCSVDHERGFYMRRTYESYQCLTIRVPEALLGCGRALGTDDSVRLASVLRATSAPHVAPTSSESQRNGKRSESRQYPKIQLIRAIGPRRQPVSETIKDRKGVTTLNKERLDRWAEYFEQQLLWPPAATHLELTVDVEPWTVKMELSTASEV